MGSIVIILFYLVKSHAELFSPTKTLKQQHEVNQNSVANVVPANEFALACFRPMSAVSCKSETYLHNLEWQKEQAKSEMAEAKVCAGNERSGEGGMREAV